MKVWVTGGHGFLGTYVVKELVKKGYEVLNPVHAKVNLMNKGDVHGFIDCYHPEKIIHLAALCGGIGANKNRPGDFFYQNLMMGIQLIEAARLYKIKKFVQVGTVCSYPKFAHVPFNEFDLWQGYPEETNAPYGIAKKALLVQLQAYRQQYNFPGIYLIPVNLYGPGDNFNPETSHVIPAIIRKIDEAIKEDRDEIEVWGTGLATREFLYVEDCACGIIDSLEKYDKPDPINLGTGNSIKIEGLVYLISDLMEYRGEVKWDETKPDGQPARQLDISKAEKEINWKPKTDLITGLEKTIEWWRGEYERNK